MKSSISVIIPALNEEANLAATIDLVASSVSSRFLDYELIVVNDGSQDSTAEVANTLARHNRRIRVVHHFGNMGLGYSFREGVELANMDYIGWLPGDSNGIFTQDDVDGVFDAVGKADFVLIFLSADYRTRLRRNLSRGFVRGMNLLFGMNVKYFNAANFFRRGLIKQMTDGSDGYGLFSGILIRLVRSGCSYVEVGVANRDQDNSSKALQLKNLLQVVKAVLQLVWEVRIVPSERMGPLDTETLETWRDRRQPSLSEA